MTSPTAPASDPAARWRDELAAWAIPQQILDAAPESPYGFPVGMFRADPQPRDSPSRQRALDALPAGGTVLDVGCGGGAASMALVPPAGRVVGVDTMPEMLTAFAGAAQARGVQHAEITGAWPEVADQAGRADVVVAHHVVYNVPDLIGFAAALTTASRRRVVLELTDAHPWVPTNALWLRFHDLDRPSGPTAALAAEALRRAGVAVHRQDWHRPARRTSRQETVAFVRRRLCLPADRDPDVDAALPADFQFGQRDVTTLWWDVASPT